MLLGILYGCGTSDYERRLDARVTEYKNESKFNILSSPADVPGTPVSIRIPQDFKNPPLTAGAEVDGKPVEARRIEPEVISLPELKLTYEGFIEDANHGKLPYYLYVAVTSDPRRANFPRTMRLELSNKFPDATELSEIRTPTPEGRDINWKKCRATGNQEFYYISPEGKAQFLQMNGLIELLFLEDKENDVLVILAWRMPASIEQSINFQTLEPMVAGCVKVNAGNQ